MPPRPLPAGPCKGAKEYPEDFISSRYGDAIPVDDLLESGLVPKALHEAYRAIYSPRSDVRIQVEATAGGATWEHRELMERVMQICPRPSDTTTTTIDMLEKLPEGVMPVVVVATAGQYQASVIILPDLIPKEAIKQGQGIESTDLVIGDFTNMGVGKRRKGTLDELAEDLLTLRIVKRALSCDDYSDRAFRALGKYAEGKVLKLEKKGLLQPADDADNGPSPCELEHIDINIRRLHRSLRTRFAERKDGWDYIMLMEHSLGEAMEACGDFRAAGFLYSDAAMGLILYKGPDGLDGLHSYCPLLGVFAHKAADWFHNSGLAFKRANQLDIAEDMYCAALYLNSLKTDSSVSQAVQITKKAVSHQKRIDRAC